MLTYGESCFLLLEKSVTQKTKHVEIVACATSGTTPRAAPRCGVTAGLAGTVTGALVGLASPMTKFWIPLYTLLHVWTFTSVTLSALPIIMSTSNLRILLVGNGGREHAIAW